MGAETKAITVKGAIGRVVCAVALAFMSVPIAAQSALPQADAASNWSADFNLHYKAGVGSHGGYTLTNVSVNDNGDKIGNITITFPSKCSFSAASTPTGWTKGTKSDASGVVSFSIADPGATPAQVKTFLESASFPFGSASDSPDASDSIRVSYAKDTSVTVPRKDENGLWHYYRFVPKNTGNWSAPSTWAAAYNSAKNTEYLGLKGYLATITSADEQKFIYDSIAEKSGYLGGTRAVYADDFKKINDEQSIAKTDAEGAGGLTIEHGVPNEDKAHTTQWYWACGPESGLMFMDSYKYDAAKVTPGCYENFSSPGEPNNSIDWEGYLQFAYSGEKWNDLRFNGSYSAETNDALRVEGYYMEFGGYEGETPALEGADYVITEGSGFDADGATVAGTNFVSKTGGSGFTADKIIEYTNASATDGVGVPADATDISVDQNTLDALNEAKVAGKTGDYPLTITYTDPYSKKTVKKTVSVNLRANGSDAAIADKPEKSMLGSDNATITTGNSKAMTPADVRTLCNAVAYDENGLDISSSLIPDATQLKAINTLRAKGIVGAFPLDFVDSNGNKVTSYITLEGKTDIVVSITGGKENATPGEEITYDVNIENKGTAQSEDGVVVFKVPDGMVIVDTDGGVLSEDGKTISYPFDPLDPKTKVTHHPVVKIEKDVPIDSDLTVEAWLDEYAGEKVPVKDRISATPASVHIVSATEEKDGTADAGNDSTSGVVDTADNTAAVAGLMGFVVIIAAGGSVYIARRKRC